MSEKSFKVLLYFTLGLLLSPFVYLALDFVFGSTQ